MVKRLFPEDPAGSTTEIRGILDRITFQNEENGYTVARVQGLENEKKLVTVIGFLSGVPVTVTRDRKSTRLNSSHT